MSGFSLEPQLTAQMCESSPKIGEIEILPTVGRRDGTLTGQPCISVYTCILSKISNLHLKIALSPRLNRVAGSSGAWILHNLPIGDGFWRFLPFRSSLGVPTESAPLFSHYWNKTCPGEPHLVKSSDPVGIVFC